MNNLWSTLVPLAIASAVVPLQIVVTILLLRSDKGPGTASAWIAGMTAVRLLQGLLFGAVFSSSDPVATDGDATSPVVATLLLVLAVLFYVTAVRYLMSDDGHDAPPPKWMAMTETLTPGKAFLIGAGYLLIAPKFWVFTLGAVGAINDAELSAAASVGALVVFVVLAEIVHFALLGFTLAAPTRAAVVLERASTWLADHNRVIMIVLGFVFGTWFLIKALDGLGVI